MLCHNQLKFVVDACQLGGYFQLEHGLCVKQYEVDLPYAFAQEYCNDESGRLVRIDTLSKYYSLRDHLIAYTSNIRYYQIADINKCFLSEHVYADALPIFFF